MSSQPSLPGIDAAPVATDRLFFAIFPQADAAASIEQLSWGLRRKHRLNGRSLATERFHVSLVHLGDFAGLPQNILAMAGKAANAVAATIPPFEIVFDRAMSFVGRPGNHPFVLCGGDGVAALTAFHHALDVEVAKVGFKIRKSHFTPHLTLLYGDHVVAEQIIEPVDWTVRDFVLVHSLLDQGRYEPPARWHLML